jgi:DNA-binding IclR family transcriptional regulator
MIAEARLLPNAVIDDAALEASLARIRANAFDVRPSREFVGITDICAPILGPDGNAVASVVVAYVNRHGAAADHERVLKRLVAACHAIGAALHGPASLPR